MGLKTREDYLAALRQMRPNVYKYGELIEDVTTHPATKRMIETHALSYDAAHNPELEEIYTATSMLTGERILRWNSLMQSSDDLIYNMKLKRQNFRRTGNCTGAVCVGWALQNVMWATAYEMDRDLGTDYQERLKNWLLSCERRGITVAGAITDAKGDRSLKPSQQPDPDTNVHVTEVREDGIVIRGAKVMIAGVAAAQEIVLIPGAAYGEADADYAVSCAVPRDVEGLTIVEATRPSDRREMDDPADNEGPSLGSSQGYLLFDNVFVPRERVFMCREHKYTGKAIQFFTCNYRACMGGCLTGQGDVMIGAAILMARANGLSAKTFMSKLVDMSVDNQITYGLGAGASAMGARHPSGAWVADALTAHTNKVMAATLPYQVRHLAQEVGGGIAEVGCMPSYTDYTNPEYGPVLTKVLKAGPCSAETRYKAARLTEWLTAGTGVLACTHGGGSPDGAKLAVRMVTPMEEYVEYAKKIINIQEDVPEPQKAK